MHVITNVVHMVYFVNVWLWLQVTIKALAVSSDRLRESSVVTKTFFVEAVSEREEEEEEEEERGGEVRKTFTLTHTHTHTAVLSPAP